MTGFDTDVGGQYQDYVSVLRVLDLLRDANLISLEFQTPDTETEDIIMRYTDHVLLDQAKKNETGSWSVSDIRRIMAHFIDSYESLGRPADLQFRFTTNARYNSEMREISVALEEIRMGLYDNQPFDDVARKISPLFVKEATSEFKIQFAKRVEFKWGTGGQSSAGEPLEGIRRECRDSLIHETRMTDEKAAAVVESICVQVRTLEGRRRRPRTYTVTDLEKVIPEYVRVESRIDAWNLPVKIHSAIMSLNPTYFKTAVVLEDGKEHFQAPALVVIDDTPCVLWRVDHRTIPGEFALIDRVVASSEKIKHIIVSDGNIEPESFGQLARACVVMPQQPQRVEEIVRGWK